MVMISSVLFSIPHYINDTVYKGQWKHYKYNVKSGDKFTTKFTKVSKYKGAYLYVKVDKNPTFWSRDCKQKKVNRECTFTFGKDAKVHIGIYGRKGTSYTLKTDIKKPENNTGTLDFKEPLPLSLSAYVTKEFKLKATKTGKVKVTLFKPTQRYHNLYVNGRRTKGRRDGKDTTYIFTVKKNRDIIIKVKNRSRYNLNTELIVEELSSNIVNAKVELINSMINSIKRDNGKKVAYECKGYLQNKFKLTSNNYKLNNKSLSMPSNPKYLTKVWKNNGGDSFKKITTYSYRKGSNNRSYVKKLLLQARKGDFIQMVWYPNSKKGKVLIPHTVMIFEDVSKNKPINWADSNALNRKIARYGTKFPWGSEKTLDKVLDYMASQYCTNECGATLYRLTDKIQKK